MQFSWTFEAVILPPEFETIGLCAEYHILISRVISETDDYWNPRAVNQLISRGVISRTILFQIDYLDVLNQVVHVVCILFLAHTNMARTSELATQWTMAFALL